MNKINRKVYKIDDVIRNPDNDILIINSEWIGYLSENNIIDIWYHKEYKIHNMDFSYGFINELIEKNNIFLRKEKIKRLIND